MRRGFVLLLMEIVPPSLFIKSCATHIPRPVPVSPFVVKNGSMMYCSISGDMPDPVSPTVIRTMAAEYESLKTCPDDLLLFMHHVPYTHRLHDGKTVIQYIYDTHYWGAKAAAAQIPAWESLHGKVPESTYDEMLERLKFQAGDAIVWRDAITRYFARMSGIPDGLHRVGNYPGASRPKR